MMRRQLWLNRVGADAWVSAVKRSPIPFEVWQHHHPDLGFQSLLETPSVLVLYHVPNIGWRCVDEAVSVEQMLKLLRIAGRTATLTGIDYYPLSEVLTMLDWIYEVSKLRIVWTARGREFAHHRLEPERSTSVNFVALPVT